MADDKKPQTAQNTGVTEKQALDENRTHHQRAALKPGYSYRYRTIRNKDGKKQTVKVFEKA